MSHRAVPIHLKKNRPNMAKELLVSTGSLIARYPSIVGGGTAFIIIFSFIAANALHYQKTEHPAPILNMRGPQQLISGSTRPIPVKRVAETNKQPIAQEVGTTYRVTHGDDIQTSSVRLPVPVSKPDQPALERGIVLADKVPELSGDKLVREIQEQLAKRKLYLDVVDGLTGPNTRKAIEQFQKASGVSVDGKPSASLLKLLKANAQAQNTEVSMLKKADSPRADELVRKIQSGLKKAAYPDIEVDGFAGEETRNAIRMFEKHYRLPVTGQPSQAILDTLASIGAL